MPKPNAGENAAKQKKMTRKDSRRQKYEQNGRKIKLEKSAAKRERQESAKKIREKEGDAACPKGVPRTLENTREYDATVVDVEDEEVAFDERNDEFATYFNKETEPKVLITTTEHGRLTAWKLCYELRKVVPNSKVLGRRKYGLKELIKKAIANGYTDLVVINDDQAKPNGMMICHLPEGPTAYFKINTLRFTKDIKRTGASTSHHPEIILNNFNTRLGHKVGRMLACLFPQSPNFKGRRAVTFHNQRDYIFFRHHRYEFKREGEKAALLELGPRFTLRLKWLQKGTFDSKGEYEWVLKRHEMETSRRRFFL